MKNQKNSFLAFFRIIEKISDIIISVTVIAIIFVVLLQIFARFFEFRTAWTEECSRYLFIWMMFIGIAASVRRGEVARVTVFLDLMPKTLQAIFKYIYFIMSLIFFIFISYTGLRLVEQQMAMREVGTVMQINMWLIGLCVPISGILGIVNLVGCFLYDINSIKGGGIE